MYCHLLNSLSLIRRHGQLPDNSDVEEDLVLEYLFPSWHLLFAKDPVLCLPSKLTQNVSCLL